MADQKSAGDGGDVVDVVDDVRVGAGEVDVDGEVVKVKNGASRRRLRIEHGARNRGSVLLDGRVVALTAQARCAGRRYPLEMARLTSYVNEVPNLGATGRAEKYVDVG